MRLLFVIFYALAANCFAQEFAGQIIFKTSIVAKHDGINTDSILEASSGDSAVYYISGSKYKCTFFRQGKEVYQYIYHHSKFRFYFLYPNIQFITFSDSRKPHDAITDIKIFRDSTSVILGYPTYMATKTYDDHRSIAYYSDSIKINPETFNGHHAADWDNELKKTGGCFNIKSVSEYKDYLEVTEAVRISPMVLPDDFFKLPDNKPVIASSYALDKEVSMVQSHNTADCYQSKASQLKPSASLNKKVRCLIAFIVTAEGKITHVHALHEDEDKAFQIAIDVIKNCEISFTPGEINGHPVDSGYFVPVDFQF